MSTSQWSFNKFVFTFGAGLITGTVLTLLYAPTSGKKLQKKVSGMAGRVVDKIDEVQQSVRNIANA